MLPTPPLPLLRCCLPRVYARWSIANLPETQALLNYFQGKVPLTHSVAAVVCITVLGGAVWAQ